MSTRANAKEIFNDAIELPAEQRAAFLERACGGDAALRAKVEQLLAVYDGAGGFLGGRDGAADLPLIVAAAAEAVLPTAEVGDSRLERPGAVIGRYKLLELVGKGGFGEVWVAEQREPVRRKVALKIVKIGMDTREVLARFEAERQALALMDHPNVAKVYDAGATDTGRPYFVMEHVPGLPVTEYCDTAKLKIRDRLGLFIDVCQAVQHAHQKGIIHRDLKPSNILVTLHDGRAVPKVIDFGIAKATIGRLTDRTLYTEVGRLIGTPEYMAPEQAGTSGLDVDTRADIYSLGVVLYQLLTGTLPFDAKTLRSAGFDGMARIIREMEPPKPSTRLSTLATEAVNRRDGATPEQIAKHHGTDIRALQRELRGDLDWITLKALEKDRARRYETASSLAADVRRFLSAEPVFAAPPSAAYRVRKFVRRKKGAVLAGSAVAAALMLAFVGTAWQWLGARQFLLEAEQQAYAAGRNAARASLAQEEAERQRDAATASNARLTQFIDRLGKKVEMATETLYGFRVGARVERGALHMGPPSDKPSTTTRWADPENTWAVRAMMETIDEAVQRVGHLQQLLEPEIARIIRTDPFLTELQRQSALGASDLSVREAMMKLGGLQDEYGTKPRMLAAIDQDSSMPAWMKLVLRRLIADWQPSASELNAAAWRVAARRHATATLVSAALEAAEEANRQKPDDGAILNTLGVALYRHGRFEESLARLLKAEDQYAITETAPHPADWAFIAMAQFKLGRTGEARASLEKLREMMRDAKWKENAELQGFLKEAEALIEGPPVESQPSASQPAASQPAYSDDP